MLAFLISVWGNALAGCFFALFFLVFWLLRGTYHAARVWQWSEKFSLEQVPEVSDWWEDLVARIYRLQKTRQEQFIKHRAETEELHNLLHALPEGIITLNQQYEILWCDKTAAEHLGLDAQRDLGLPIINLVRYPDFVRYISNEQAFMTDQVLKMPAPKIVSGSARTLSIRLMRYTQAQSLLLTRDISQWEKLETMRRDFIANVSHELRTPLTVVTGFLETLQEQQLAEREQAQYLRLMAEQTQRMQRLVEDLLTLSALESGSTRTNDETVNMAMLLAQLENDARILSHGQHQISFFNEAHSNIYGNQQELLSAFSNLVSNAIRYTPVGGSIRIHWKLKLNTQGDTLAGIFSVEDEGIGIGSQHLPRLTERFYRVDRSRSRATGGTGLGLAIVKHVLLHHQAKLNIESTPGIGSIFSIEFPIERLV